MKLFGLTNPHNPPTVKAYATSSSFARTTSSARFYNMVGFQTKLKDAELPHALRNHFRGLAKAEFARLGGLHRNTFLIAGAANTTAPLRRTAAALCRADDGLRRLRLEPQVSG